MPRHYRKLRGNSAYYPFAARTGMRARQRREVRALRIAGTVLLGAAAALLLRQTVGRGGQPEAPVQPVPSPALVETAENARGSSITVQPVAATRDALAATLDADDAAHATPAPAAPAAHIQEVLPVYRDLYEQNPDLIGWLTIDGTDIDLPVVQTPATMSTTCAAALTGFTPPAVRCSWTSTAPSISTPPPPTG